MTFKPNIFEDFLKIFEGKARKLKDFKNQNRKILEIDNIVLG